MQEFCFVCNDMAYFLNNSPIPCLQAGVDDHSEAQGTPRDAQSPETASPTRAISSAEGTGKALGDGVSSKHEQVCY